MQPQVKSAFVRINASSNAAAACFIKRLRERELARERPLSETAVGSVTNSESLLNRACKDRREYSIFL